MANFLASACGSKYSCGSLKESIDAELLAPWVKAEFKNSASGAVITVGNNSSPQFGNTAGITSFELGMSDGLKLTLEIIDEEGGAFNEFVDKLVKCLKDANVEDSQALLEVTFGWVKNNGQVISSDKIKCTPVQMDITFQAGGLIKYTITAPDPVKTVFNSREEDSYGEDSQKMRLKDAIRELCATGDPVMEVEFARKEGGEWGFNEGGFNGPKDKWSANRQNKLSVIRQWIEPFRTDRDLGIVINWNPNEGKLTLFEDYSGDCSEGPGCNNSIGTFIVNGGNLSNVINFAPQINWPAGFAKLSQGGNTGGAETGKTTRIGDNESSAKSTDCTKPKDGNKKAGLQQSVNVTEQARNAYGSKKALDETTKSVQAHNKANGVYQTSLQPIEAELTIQGDPSFSDLVSWMGKFASIIVINPFHIRGGGQADCGDWLARPGCNQILSNKFWQIQGLSHSIKEGSYTTTFKLFLAAPGIDLEEGAAFGGVGSAGYKVKTCSV